MSLIVTYNTDQYKVKYGLNTLIFFNLPPIDV
jgi:hypothetical protein